MRTRNLKHDPATIKKELEKVRNRIDILQEDLSTMDSGCLTSDEVKGPAQTLYADLQIAFEKIQEAMDELPSVFDMQRLFNAARHEERLKIRKLEGKPDTCPNCGRSKVSCPNEQCCDEGLLPSYLRPM